MKIARMTKGDWGKIKAFFDLDLNGIIIKGFKLIDAGNGLFVGSPSVKNKEGKYDPSVIVPKEKQPELQELATKYYKEN